MTYTPEDVELYRTVLRPHRSLGPTGFRVLMIAVGAASAVASIPFFIVGAWPVVGFFGLDVLLLYLAFRWSYRTARAREELALTHFELSVRKVSHWGEHAEWRFNPSWVRLHREVDEDYGLQRVAIVERQTHLNIGGFLAPEDRAAFARDFGAALSEAKRGPRYT
ncbi:DUF2244 domain-containing protein [Terrihabitans rhizophilus]|uniref:DUF2244 domain-containing protein n=1 Tax=Terrihabitans rhizophilus TaxID=3092662 RepID=A0ABU4RN43_9HYPH|nr:DUF2244 domain-containing protein [Terrihabitans sp. PJ23]MDX6805080.1 DUF2244 domain-containing protein [Terrihabitans sp. PJ23]